jgi:hypothetical protein
MLLDRQCVVPADDKRGSGVLVAEPAFYLFQIAFYALGRQLYIKNIMTLKQSAQ